MGRQYIGIEQMDYIEDIAIARLKKVIGTKIKPDGELLPRAEYDTGGISKSVNWQGGGVFIYLELKKYNQQFIEAIDQASNTEELLTVRQAILEKGFINYRLKLGNINETKNNAEFQALALKEQKKILLDCLDKNQLYINYSEQQVKMY